MLITKSKNAFENLFWLWFQNVVASGEFSITGAYFSKLLQKTRTEKNLGGKIKSLQNNTDEKRNWQTNCGYVERIVRPTVNELIEALLIEVLALQAWTGKHR